ncbi:MAG TPA: hypothetical protein VND22_01465 [Actinomycetota bacterium]|nr:hypothetical protein [Actinomycetota bacterium]
MNLIALSADKTRSIVAEGGILIDLRPIELYIQRHIRGSIPLLFEDGPGFGGRARDLLPLDARLVLLNDDESPLAYSADMLRGKGFDVAGFLQDFKMWRGADMAPTSAFDAGEVPANLKLLHVRDPGTIGFEDALSIPAERLWTRAAELDKSETVGVLSGWGVRAAAAVGILERIGFSAPALVRTRLAGSKPPTAGPESEIFRVK